MPNELKHVFVHVSGNYATRQESKLLRIAPNGFGVQIILETKLHVEELYEPWESDNCVYCIPEYKDNDSGYFYVGTWIPTKDWDYKEI